MDSIHEQVVMVVYDTVREVTTITFHVSEAGDTVRTDRVTDRKVGELIIMAEKTTKVSEAAETVSDTVIVHDSVNVANDPLTETAARGGATSKSKVSRILFWIFAIILALTGLVFLIKKR